MKVAGTQGVVVEGVLFGKPLLTWQLGEVMAAVTVADRRRSVISAVGCTLVVRRSPVLQLQRHHRSHIAYANFFSPKHRAGGQKG